MRETQEFLESIGLPGRDLNELPDSPRRFRDGVEIVIEISGTEGPRALRAVVEAAQRYVVPVHRVSQATGIILMTDAEIRDMLQIGLDHGMEVRLFGGPRAS